MTTSVGARALARKLAVLAVSTLLLAACGSDDDDAAPSDDDGGPAASDFNCEAGPATLEPVKIGLAWVDGIDELDEAAHASIEYANDCLGGIGGHPIEPIDCPIDETNPASATECANKVIEQGAVAMVVTITSQGQTLVPAVTDAGIPYITSTGVSPAESLDSTGKVFTLTGGVASIMGAMAIEAKEDGIKKVALLVPSNAAAAVGGLAGIPFGNAGVEYEVVSLAEDSPDLSPQVAAAISDGAEAVTAFGESTICIGFINAAFTVAPDSHRWITGSCAANEVTDAVGADALDGTLLFGGGDPAADTPELNEYRAVMAEYTPDTATEGFAASAYVSIIGLVRGLSGIGEDVSAESITTTMAATKDIPLPASSDVTYSCSEQPLPPLTVCSGLTTVSEMDGITPVNPKVVDAAEVFATP